MRNKLDTEAWHHFLEIYATEHKDSNTKVDIEYIFKRQI
jgi:hypothetical protein